MFDNIYLCRDWHVKDHISFVGNHKGMSPFETKIIEETGLDQIMWPDHCIQGTYGAQYHKDLVVKNSDI